MSSRSERLETFLFLAGWGQAWRNALAGDASQRRYERLIHPGLGTAVLMDAPPSKGEDVRPFINIATHLHSLGLSAPKILARDAEQGFLILEDLGDSLYARTLEESPHFEKSLYTVAVDALLTAQKAAPPDGIATYGPDEMAQAACLAVDWYLEAANPDAPDIRAEFHDRLKDLLQEHLTGQPVLTQRDYHAENLIWLPDRIDVARVGLLDFQDAMLCHGAYDLASLLKDARRDVSRVVQRVCMNHYTGAFGLEEDAFRTAYATCSAQRNLRIMGVFTRLCVRDGKRHYPSLMPRVWRNLQEDLRHPALEVFGTWLMQHMPAPSPDIILRIKSAHD
jgi:aminoglycoside/choline kinase family phosphotransferase